METNLGTEWTQKERALLERNRRKQEAIGFTLDDVPLSELFSNKERQALAWQQHLVRSGRVREYIERKEVGANA